MDEEVRVAVEMLLEQNPLADIRNDVWLGGNCIGGGELKLGSLGGKV